MNSLKMIELSLTDVVIRMALAVVFGALIGLERSIKRKGFGISSNAFYVWPLVRFPFYRFNRWIF